MGTSINSASPMTPSWSIVKTVLGRPDIGVDRQTQEVWRAALSDREGALVAELAHPTIGVLFDSAKNRMNPINAINKFNTTVASSGQASLVLDMAQRAFVRAAAANGGAKGFATELFSEVISYYASRDLPSYVGMQGRLGNPKEAIELKRKLRDRTKSIAASIKPGKGLTAWKDYVTTVTAVIVRGKGKK